VRGDSSVHDSANAALVMIFAKNAIQRVTGLNLEIHGAVNGATYARAEKLVRDAMIWTHLAGDSVQQIKAAKRLLK
jgi:alkylation response protein AidB-like acyl-CoA dehydrogenase